MGKEQLEQPLGEVIRMVLYERAALKRLPEDLQVRCDLVGAIPGKDVIVLALALWGPKRWCFKDDKHQTLPHSVLEALLGLGADIMYNWVFCIWHYYRVRRLLQLGRKRHHQPRNSQKPSVAFYRSRAALYCRLDQYLSGQTGGSFSHVAGVVSSLRYHLPAVQVLSSMSLLLDCDHVSSEVLSPYYGRGRNFPELYRLAYQKQLEHWWRKKYSQLPPLGMIYGRSVFDSYFLAHLRSQLPVPYVCEFNGSEIWINKNWGVKRLRFEGLWESIEKANVFMADLVVVVSDPLKQLLQGWGIPAERILVNPNGVNTEIFHPEVSGQAVRQQLGIPLESLVIGMASTFCHWHGIEILVAALAHLLQKHPQLRTTRLVLFGAGDRQLRVQQLVAKLGLQEQVLLAGEIPRIEMPKHLAACDVLVSSFIPNPDGSPLFFSPIKLFEYMAMGGCIIASKLGQMAEVIQHGKNGWLAVPDDVESLSQALQTVLQDRQLREKLGQQARQDALKHHTWKQHTLRILDSLEALAPPHHSKK